MIGRTLRATALAVVVIGCTRGGDSRARAISSSPRDSSSPIFGAHAVLATWPKSWVGQRFASIPDSVVDFGGDAIDVADTVFGVRFVAFRGQHALWMARGTGKGPSGAAEWTILATLGVEPVGDERVFFHDCRLNKKPDRRIIALGLWDDLPLFTRIRRAWRPNLQSRSFDEISVAGIDCKNTDRGE